MNLKNLFFLTIICWSLGIMACEPDPPTEPETLNYPFTLENATPAPPDVTQAIDDFEAYLEHPRPDELEPMNIKNVVWSVEAKLNRTYTNVAHKFEQLHTQSDTIAIAHSGSMMSGSEVQGFYDEAVAKFSEHFYSLPADNRLPVLVDVAEYADDPNSLIVTTQVGTGSLEETIASFDLHWYWGALNSVQNDGTCGPDDGVVTELGRGANTELEREANNRFIAISNPTAPIQVAECMPGPPIVCTVAYYVTSVETMTPFIFLGGANPDDDLPFDNCKDWLIYENLPTSFNQEVNANYEDKKCLKPDDMNYYYDGLIQVMSDNRPVGKDFITVDVSALLAEVDGQIDPPGLQHAHRYSYGEIIESPVNPPPVTALPQ